MDPFLIVALAFVLLCLGLLVLMARILDAMHAQEQGEEEDETDTVVFIASERAPRSGVEPPRSVTVVSRT